MDDQKIKDLIKENSVGVVSTSGRGGVASAAVYYVTDAEGAIYFHSKRESEKMQNIATNPQVSFVIFQHEPDVTLQVKGHAEVVPSLSHIQDVYMELIKRSFRDGVMPPIMRIGEGHVELVKITPTWMRLGNFDGGADMFDVIVEK